MNLQLLAEAVDIFGKEWLDSPNLFFGGDTPRSNEDILRELVEAAKHGISS